MSVLSQEAAAILHTTSESRSNLCQEESAQGRWAKGPSIDGKGEFQYVANPQSLGPEPNLPQPEPRLHGTAKTPQASQGGATSEPNMVDRVVEVIDKITPGGQS